MEVQDVAPVEFGIPSRKGTRNRLRILGGGFRSWPRGEPARLRSGPPGSIPSDPGIQGPLQGAGPRKGFVARQGRPFGYGGQAQERARRRTASTPHKRGTSMPDAARGSLVAAEKASPWATGACGSVCTASPLSDSLRPARRTDKYACAVLGRPSRSDGASASPRLPTLPGTGPSLRLRCPLSPYRRGYASVGRLAGRGASALSVHGLFGNGPPEAGLTEPPSCGCFADDRRPVAMRGVPQSGLWSEERIASSGTGSERAQGRERSGCGSPREPGSPEAI